MVSKDFIAWWNSMFPYDRWWRNKHNVAFNSPIHREACYIDIVFEYMEDKLVHDYTEQYAKDLEKEKLYKDGIWIKRDVTEEQAKEDALFDKLKLNLTGNG